MADANTGFQPSYGDDAVTKEACEAFRRFFATDCDVYFVFNGTAANSLALASLCNSYNSIIAAEEAHCEKDECGAPEFFSHGAKILLARSPHGKLDPADVERLITHRTDIHFPKPSAISISNSTELGTIYRPEDIKTIADLAHRHGLRVQMDGARFFNALAAQTCSPADLTWRAGLDVLCCGGTKLGMASTEAVVFFNRELGEDFAWRCKQAGQLCSKMRFISAQWLRMLADEAWRKHASHGNRLARKLADRLAALPGVEILHPVEANAVFARLPDRHQGRSEVARLEVLQLHRRRFALHVLVARDGRRCGSTRVRCDGICVTCHGTKYAPIVDNKLFSNNLPTRS